MPRSVFEFSPAYRTRSQDALETALGTAPAYAAWRTLDPGPDADLDDRYAALPVLTKRELRAAYPAGLVPGGRDVEAALARGEIETVRTNGTTEEAVSNLWHQPWWDASEAASWKLNAHTQWLDGTQREAQLTSALSVGFRAEHDLPVSERLLGRFLFLNEKASPAEWTARHFERMARELAEYRPPVIEANPSYLARLAWWALDHGVKLAAPQVILLTYELPAALQLREIRRVFRAPVVSSYGSTEAGYVFMECEQGRLHQNTATCRVDFQPLKPEHGGPELGRILVTTFGHPWAALVRFDPGDLVRLAPGPCACGRRDGWVLASVEGRLANATFTPEGRLITNRSLDDALAAVPGLRDYQLEQTAPAEYRVRVLADASAPAPESAVRAALAGLYGPSARFEVSAAASLPAGPSGKFRRAAVLWPSRVPEVFA